MAPTTGTSTPVGSAGAPTVIRGSATTGDARVRRARRRGAVSGVAGPEGRGSGATRVVPRAHVARPVRGGPLRVRRRRRGSAGMEVTPWSTPRRGETPQGPRCGRASKRRPRGSRSPISSRTSSRSGASTTSSGAASRSARPTSCSRSTRGRRPPTARRACTTSSRASSRT